MSFSTGLGFCLAVGFVVSASAALAGNQVPTCMSSYGQPLAVNNQQVLHWERTTQNQYQDRGHIQGTVAELFPYENGHVHFSVQIGSASSEVIEVIYNTDFGQIPNPAPGMSVEACGDYITSTAQSGPYPASPDGAILHWVHMNPQSKGHPPGFLILQGQLFGQDAANAGPRRYKN